MSPAIRMAAPVLLAMVAAGCTPQATPNPEMEALLDLDAAHRPLLECVETAMRSRPDFTGGLPRIIVDAGMAPELQALRRKYLAGGEELAGQPREAQVAATQSALLALGTYGGGGASPGETAHMRRMMAMVETTTTIAAATGIDCAPSDTLISLMNKAENEYL